MLQNLFIKLIIVENFWVRAGAGVINPGLTLYGMSLQSNEGITSCQFKRTELIIHKKSLIGLKAKFLVSTGPPSRYQKRTTSLPQAHK